MSLAKNQDGIGLVEVILAFGVAVMVTVAMVSLGAYVLRISTESSRLTQGTRLANQELESIRVARDLYASSPTLSWEDFYNAVLGGGAVPVCNLTCTASDCSCGTNSCYVSLSGGVASINKAPPKVVDGITVCFGAKPVTVAGVRDPEKIDIIAVASWNIGGHKKNALNYTRLTNWKKQ